jgi:hypothetical protein
MDKQLVKRVLPGSFAIDNDNGWMISEIFLLYLEHFCTHVISTAENPLLLILYTSIICFSSSHSFLS